MNHLYPVFAELLEYPGARWAEQVERCKAQLEGRPELSPSFAEFCRKTAALSLSALQELYTQTFDLNPVCALDVGYQLFGENYKRGVFLAHLRETEGPYDLGQESQLPDYLPVLLRLLAKLDPEALRADLITECLVPATNQMAEALKASGNPYADLIRTIGMAVRSEISPDVELRSERADGRCYHV